MFRLVIGYGISERRRSVTDKLKSDRIKFSTKKNLNIDAQIKNSFCIDTEKISMWI